jgi:hypothetical protein
MDLLYYLFIGSIALAAALASLAIWAPRISVVRCSALALTILFAPIAYLQMAELLSKPKPMAYEWYERQTDKAIVLGISFDEGQAIYLWLRLPHSKEPRYYKIPWSVKFAQKLEDASDEAVQRNGQILMRNPFIIDGFDDLGDLNVEIVPPAAPLPKQPRFPPRIVDPREMPI